MTEYLTLADRRLAYQQHRAPAGKHKKYGVVFLSGYGSDMAGTKASYLAERCESAGRDYLRFDYRGTGESSGAFEQGTIGAWREDALAMLDQFTEGPQLLVGSSMGGWMMMLLAIARRERIAGLIGIAAAPDFTEELVWNNLSPSGREKLLSTGKIFDDSAPEQQRLPMTRLLIEEGRNHLVLDKTIAFDGPVHLLQGKEDSEVPWSYPERIATTLPRAQVKISLIENGDHRLSRPEDLERLWRVIEEMS